MKYAFIFEQGETSVGASVPDFPGCIAVAGTLGEARVSIAEAITFHIKGLCLDGDPVPEPSCHAEDVLVAA